jgi:hypothetical protein
MDLSGVGANEGDDELEVLLERIQERVRAKKYWLTSHAEREREADQISVKEIEDALLLNKCEVAEDYPDDPRGHSCLILGFTTAGLPLHLVCGISPEKLVIIITVYRPDPSVWINWRTRREG